MKKRIYENIVLTFFLAGGALFLSEGLTKNELSSVFRSEATKPYDVPNIVVGIVMLLCMILLIKNIIAAIKERRSSARVEKTLTDECEQPSECEASDEEKAQEAVNKKKVTATLLLIIGYVFAWKYLGFYIATPLFIFIDSLILPTKRNVKLAILNALVTTVVCYLVFTLMFKIRFPFPMF